MSTNRTEIKELGEFGLIERIKNRVELKSENIKKGIGDDAAVLAIDPSKKMVISTDTLTEGVHFDLSYTPLKHLGYKSVVVNLSDIYAMNAVAKYITVSISFSNRFPVEAIDEIYEGILLACKMYEVDLIGGDTTSSLSGLTLNVTAIGEADEEKIAYRDGASETELIVLSGDVGSAYMGLQILEREKQVFKANDKIQPDLDGFDYILERILKPEARKDIVKLLAEMDVKPTSMIDVSDGLASELLHICNQSNVGCDIYENKLPIDPKTVLTLQDFEIPATTVALNGGEDYELLFTVKQDDYEKIKGNPHLTVIGHITDKGSGTNLITRDGKSTPLTAQGWDAFLNKGE